MAHDDYDDDSHPIEHQCFFTEYAKMFSSKHEDIIRKTKSMDIHIQRTLEESYYLGLNGAQLKELHEKQTKDESRLKPDKDVLISQLWLWRMGNVVITACPREAEYRASHLFEHTLSSIRKKCSSTRSQMDSAQLATTIFAECIHQLDYPCIAGLKEPILYRIGRVAAETLSDVIKYIDEDVDKSSIEKEMVFANRIDSASRELAMVKNIISRQKEVCETFCKLPKVPARLDDTLYGPKADFVRFQRRIQRIEEDIERSEKSVLFQLDLKAKHAGLTESHNSILLSKVATCFAVITVIFTPLSWLTSLLALPIDELVKHTKNKQYASSYVTGSMCKSSQHAVETSSRNM
jgi:hypothetical protein